MSLRSRLALGLGLITALVVGGVGLGAFAVTGARLRDEVDQSLRASATAVVGPGRPVERDDDHDRDGPGEVYEGFTRPAVCPPAGALEPAAAAQLVAADGSWTACIEGGIRIPVTDGDREIAEEAEEPVIRTVKVGGRDYRVLTVARSDGTALMIARNLGEVGDVLASMRRWIAGLGLAGVAAAVLLGLLLARRTVRPVEQLRDTAERIAATEDLGVDVPVGGPSEVASLGRSFTAMVGALERSREAQRRLVRDSSHELRTPLTSLRTNASLLGRADLTDDQRARVVDAIGLEVDELTHLVAELVDLAADGGAADEPLAPTDLGALAGEVVARAARRTERPVTLTVRRAAEIEGRPAMLTRAIQNLVDNAVKYGAGPVEVLVDGGRVEVRDHGPGIAATDRPFVFDRFYRAEAARTAPGSGLGLAIVEQAVDRHGGTVFVADPPDGVGVVIGFSVPSAT